MSLDARKAALGVVGGLAALYLVATLAAPGLVGIYHDDGIYIGTAISLAEGEGYRIPHLPAAPLQAKYPPLFSALLVPVALLTGGPGGEGLSPGALAAFRWPGLLSMFGALALLPGLFRRWGLAPRASLWATALTGCSPLVFQHAFHVMSEAPFFLLSVATLRLLPSGDEAIPLRRWIGAGACALGAVLCRSVGIALILGCVASAWPRRRDWRAWVPVAAPVVAFGAWSIVAGAMRAAEAARELGPFYDYYLGYSAWIRSDPGTVGTIAIHNAADIWLGFGTQLAGVRIMGVPGWQAIAAALGALVALGWRRLWGVDRCAAAYLAGSLALFCVWPFPVDRFLIPLTPFAVWGAWRGATMIVERLHWPDRVLRGAAVALLVSCGLADVLHFPTPGRLPLLAGFYQADDYADAGEWIRRETARDAVIVSNDDPWVWLATGRKSIPPGELDPLWFYTHPDPSRRGWQACWEDLWRSHFERFDAEAYRLGGRWLFGGRGWDAHFFVIWGGGVMRGGSRFTRRYPVGDVRDAPLWVYAIGPPSGG